MSSATTVYEATIKDVMEALAFVPEVDGIPVVFKHGEHTRVGMFSVKQDDYGDWDESHRSSNSQFKLEKCFFSETSPIGMDAFDDYEVAMEWSHP